MENEDEDDEADSIFDDPDFAHMSDSDLDDKLPLFEVRPLTQFVSVAFM